MCSTWDEVDERVEQMRLRLLYQPPVPAEEVITLLKEVNRRRRALLLTVEHLAREVWRIRD